MEFLREQKINYIKVRLCVIENEKAKLEKLLNELEGNTYTESTSNVSNSKNDPEIEAELMAIAATIEDKDSTVDFTKKQRDYIFEFPEKYDCFLKPVKADGTINHGYLKGFKMKNTYKGLSSEFKGWQSNIGFYQDTSGGANHGKLQWSIRDNDRRTGTAWWFKPDKINKNIVFEDPRADYIYRNTDYSCLKV